MDIMQSPIQHPNRDWKDTISGRPQPLPLFVLIFTSMKQTSAPEEILWSHRQTLRTRIVSGQEKKKREETCCSSRNIDSKPTEWDAAGIQIPSGEEKCSKKHPREQNDAVKCFDFKKKNLPVLSFLPQTSANALKLGGRCGTQALFDPLHAHSETLEIDQPIAAQLKSPANCT